MTRRILIDGDVLIFRAALKAEKVYEWDTDLWSIAADMKEAQHHLAGEITTIRETLGGDEVGIAVSDPRGTFRHQIWPAYKSNRKQRKPLLFRPLREWAIAMDAVLLPALEADDTLGILATEEPAADCIVVTIDKDLKCIPGKHYNPDKPDLGVVKITPEEAERWHFIQTIAGDPTDGYPGVRGLGVVKAGRLLDEKGVTWETVVGAYEKVGLTEDDALIQARLAKILTAAEWDPVSKEILPWFPQKVST